MSQYQALKQQAKIYQRLIGKIGSIFHNDEDFQQRSFKLPKAVNHRTMTEEKDQSYSNNYRKNRSIDNRLQKGLSMRRVEDHSDFYSGILKQGIKMAIIQEGNFLISKTLEHGKKTLQARKKTSANSQALPKMNYGCLKTELPDNKFNANQCAYDAQLRQANTIETPLIQNQDTTELKNVQTISLKKPRKSINFLSLNKSYITRINSKQREKSLNMQSLIVPSNKQRKMLDYKNREQIRLQQDLKTYHVQNQPFIEEIKKKYKLSFSKHKKYLGNLKHEQTHIKYETSESEVFLVDQTINFDKLAEEVSYLDYYLKQNKRNLEKTEKQITNNGFSLFLQTKEASQQIDSSSRINEVVQKDIIEQNQRKLTIIQKLKNSLDYMRQRNQQEENSRNQPIQINERIKDLLF